MTFFPKQDKPFVFPMKTYQNFDKEIFMMKNFYRDQLELIRMFRINLVLWLNEKWRADNLIKPYISGYKLLNERTSGILKVFDFHNTKSNFPEHIWYNENSTVDDSSVLFYHTIAIQPTAGCLSRQSKNHKVLYKSITSIHIASRKGTVEVSKAKKN